MGAGAGAHHCGGGGAAHHPACYAYHHVSSPWACLSAGRTDANSVLNSETAQCAVAVVVNLTVRVDSQRGLSVLNCPPLSASAGEANRFRRLPKAQGWARSALPKQYVEVTAARGCGRSGVLLATTAGYFLISLTRQTNAP